MDDTKPEVTPSHNEIQDWSEETEEIPPPQSQNVDEIGMAKLAQGPEVNFGVGGDLYSKMGLTQAISTTGEGELLEIVSARDFPTEADKVNEFERIYGKLKRVQTQNNKFDTKIEHGDPPTLDNLYEALQSNFLRTIVKTCLYRLVLTGTHGENEDKLIDWLRDTIEDINVHCYNEIITGVLVLYPKHFMHVLEGSEDTLMKFVKVSADQFEPTGLDWKLEFTPGKGISVREPILFTSVKTFVIGTFQIKKRGMMTGWKVERALPLPMSQEDVYPGGFREKLYQFTKACCIMAIVLYKLTPLRYGGSSKTPNASHESIDDLQEQFDQAKRRRANMMSKIVPKTPMIDYVIKKDENRKIQLRTLREHVNYFWKVPPVVLTQQTDWPVPGRMAPYD